MNLEQTIEQMFCEAQAKLAPQDRCAARGEPMCLSLDNGFKCTKIIGHTGDHMAHGKLGSIHHRWQVYHAEP